MIPLFKVVSLIIRMFTRPVTNHLKNSLKHKHDHHPYFKLQILNLGQFYHRIQIKIQRRLMNISSSDSYVKPLPDDKALESGAEFIGEFLAYGTLFIWGIYEINKFSEEGKAKENKQAEIYRDIDFKLEGLNAKHKNLMDRLEKELNRRRDVEEKSTDTDED